MKNNIMIFGSLVALIFISMFPFVSSQTEETKSGITPDSIFWGLDKSIEKIQLLLTFNLVKKTELRLRLADERLAEIEIMIKKRKIKAREKAEIIREDEIKELGNLMEKLKEKDNRTIINILENLQKHIDKLEQIKEKAPEDAQEGLANAISKSSKVLERFRVDPEAEENVTEPIENINLECLQNLDCEGNKICINNTCQILGCRECQYISDHKCIDYKCCSDRDCDEGEECSEHNCVAIEEDTAPVIIDIIQSINDSDITTKTLMPVEHTDVNFAWPPINADFSSRSLFTATELPNLLKDGIFEHPDVGTRIQYSPILFTGSSRIKNSTNNGDLPSPKVLIEVGTDPNNYLYKYKLSFAKNINFTGLENPGAIEILGENYIINVGSTNQKIILNKEGSDSTIILEKNQPANVNGEIIDGTYVEFNTFRDSQDYVNIIDISFAMQNPNKDYIAVGESYDEPVFQSIRLTFKSFSEEKGAEIYVGSVK